MISSLVLLASLGLLLDPVSSVQTVSVQTFTSGSDGLLVTGPANSVTGNSLAQIGDYNGDGTDDFAVGSMLMTVNSVNRGGLTLIVLGRNGAWPAIDLSTAVSGATTRRVYGSNANGQSGSSVGGAGDVNDDGFADVVIGAYGVPFNGINGGAVFVVYGLAGPYTDLIVSNTFTAGAAIGYAIYGAVAGGPLGQLTSNTRGVGDINNDGVDDFALSAYAIDYASRSDAGSVWVIFGSSAAPANFVIDTLGSKGVLFGGAGSLNYAGYSLDGAGDFNNDGIPDLVFGANGYSPVVASVTRTYAGAVYVMYGRAAFAGLDLATFTTGATGVLIFGAVTNDQIGIAVSGAGDVNGDGIADIVFGTQNAVANGFASAGKAYIVFGSGTMASVAIDLSAFSAGTRGFSVLGSATNMNLGITVARAGDINQDGVGDVLISSERTDHVYLVFGSGTVPTGDINLANAPEVIAFTDSGNLGVAVYGGQDVSGDGIPDIMMGSSNINRGYMLLGPIGPPPPTSQPSSSPSSQPTAIPSGKPTSQPSSSPSTQPSADPSVQPSAVPSVQPSSAPSTQPSAYPSVMPSSQPSTQPSALPSMQPTSVPSMQPSVQPSAQPSTEPSAQPSSQPSGEPSAQPSAVPSIQPSAQPSPGPSAQPSRVPSTQPSAQPSTKPSAQPSGVPSSQPSSQPSAEPSAQPSSQPSTEPSAQPSAMPSSQPSSQPSAEPSSQPSAEPSTEPSAQPSAVPSIQPSARPSSAPSLQRTPQPTALAKTGGDASELSSAGIAAIVVGIWVFLMLLCILCTIIARARQQSEEPVAAPPQYEMAQVEEGRQVKAVVHGHAGERTIEF